jgi:hypothetical protein
MYTPDQPLKFAAAAGDEQGMTRVILSALLLAIPALTSWILVHRVGDPVRTKPSTRRRPSER